MPNEVRVVGSGVGRTGTMSLKLALERLTGRPCYHMIEVFGHPDHVETWHQAAKNEPIDWAGLLADYGAIVDWPGGSFWPELSAAFPDAVILHSERADAETWWRSAHATILANLDPPGTSPFHDMFFEIARTRFTDQFENREACIAAYEAHNARVRREADPDRLLFWQPGDGWEPLCAALGAAVPDEPFPHTNTTEEWQAGGPPQTASR